MGRVLLARDPVLERHVAIKLLRDDLNIASDVIDSLLVRMRHEARAAARVTHPNLVVIHDMGEDEELGLYLVFEYIEGPTLKQRLLDGRVSARQAARIAHEIGAALTYAHERGVLHRDVKPENIIISPTGTKLTDFGIARVPDSTLTHVGGLMGTPAYSAPETFRDGRFSPESDQFSLAATVYEAIRGSRAFPGDDAVSVASKIANDRPEPFAETLRYPAALDAILDRGMARDPAQRFASCKELGASIADALLSETQSRRTSISGFAPAIGADAARASAPRSEDSHLPPLHLSRADTATRSGPLGEALQDKRSFPYFIGGLVALLVVGVIVRTALKTADVTPMATAATATADPAPPTASTSAEVIASVVTAASSVKSSRRPDRVKPSAVSSTPSAETSVSASASASTSTSASVSASGSSAPAPSASAPSTGSASAAPRPSSSSK